MGCYRNRLYTMMGDPGNAPYGPREQPAAFAYKQPAAHDSGGLTAVVSVESPTGTVPIGRKDIMSPITTRETQRAAAVVELIGSPNMCLVRSTLDGAHGHEVVVLADATLDEETGSVYISPLAIIVDDHLMDRLTNPADSIVEVLS